ncbi:translation initiation factor IF-2 [Candidatus Nomurabacteria bacterium RIFCSPLOWO2_01_FULL_41_21]|uniref:Translation initiation factor IF-2 n=2 Tax=Candidatus Nomuraibacteriota TaxID=1752729 RepID=A0A1F6V2K3_9BACT|nr:MAG: translation initiation factor IF-2 [Candidatus Nomurabacteria bacterium RIFCSPHIGHO2_01_FULL_40_20]OGI88741.1 MAG: translation initiation factor IF-2 [Candidatus Nomurabacteria bacterium RIFCSPLOWO2_01_FULL_41_21]
MQNKITTTERPPVVVIMGHIDHGKSTLLDYIRKTNVVDKEVGGITQSISAYEVVHKDEKGEDRKITFLDTPGHEAFSKMRERGAKVADIAILVVSAEDGVKPQTIEAWKTIVESKTPCIVAINKIDKPGADVEKTKIALAENEIYLENYGGQVPFALISAKVGEGIDELLSLINVLGELENFTGSPEENATGFVIESNLDPKRGIQATLIIKNGTLKKGTVVVVEDSICVVKIMENFQGKNIAEASFSSPIRLVGFDKMPTVGGEFKTFAKKEQAEKYAKNFKENLFSKGKIEVKDMSGKKIIPIILKADVAGTLEAIEKEVAKITSESAEFKIVVGGVGPIGEADIKQIRVSGDEIVVGFNVKCESNAKDIAERNGITISNFDIIYKLTEWLEGEMEKRRPRIETTEVSGKAKILKAFSRTKERQILGGKVTEGQVELNETVKIMRRDFEIGRGRIVNLEKGKAKTSAVEEGAEFGMMLESKIEIVPGDIIEASSVKQV